MGGEGTGFVQVWFGVVHSCPTPNHNFLLYPLIPTQGFQKRLPKGLSVSGGRGGGGRWRGEEVGGDGALGMWLASLTKPPPAPRKDISLEIGHSSGQEGGSLADRECSVGTGEAAGLGLSGEVWPTGLGCGRRVCRK